MTEVIDTPEDESIAAKYWHDLYVTTLKNAQDTDTPQREWVGLTAQEAADCWTTSASKTWHNLEARLKEKNT